MLNVGVIGLVVGQSYANCLVDHRHAKLIAVCDLNEDLMNACEEKTGIEIPLKSTNYLDLVGDPAVDIIVVATPDHLHREHVVAALEAGKHVLSEKPLALTIEDCRAILDAEARSPGKIYMGQVCRHAPGFVKAKALLDSGLIGELFFVESEYAHDYSHMDAANPNHWRKDPDIMRYPFLGGACHAVDLLRWIAGDPVEVSAYGNQKCLTDWPDVMDATIAIYRFPDNIIGKVFCSVGCKRPYTMRTLFYGTKGTIVCDNKSSAIQVSCSDWAHQNKDIRHDEWGFTAVRVEPISHNFASEVDTFLACILEGKDVDLTAYEGYKTVAACLATVESAKSLKPVEISYMEQVASM